MDGKKRKAQHEQIVPYIVHPHQRVCRHTAQSCDNQYGLVDLRPFLAYLQRDSHAGPRIRLHIPYIVDIEHSHTEKAYGRCREQHSPEHLMRRHEIRSEHGNQSEEQEYIQVAHSPVPVGIPSESVPHGSYDGRHPEHHQQKRFDGEEGPERAPYHRHAENRTQYYIYDDHHTEILLPEMPFRKRIRRPLPPGSIRSVQKVPEFIGHIAQYLETDRGQKCEKHYGPAHPVIRNGQHKAEGDTRKRKRKRAEPHRRHIISDFTHIFDYNS